MIQDPKRMGVDLKGRDLYDSPLWAIEDDRTAPLLLSPLSAVKDDRKVPLDGMTGFCIMRIFA